MSKKEVKFPPCGLFLGSGVYDHGGRLICAGQAFTYWSPDGPSARETIDLSLAHNQGNTLQFWQGGEAALELARSAVEKGLYVLFLYSTAPDSVAQHFVELGDHYLGYDFGERFSFRLEGIDGGKAEPNKCVTLRDLADNLIQTIAGHVTERKNTGWGHIMTTGSKFHMDYEIEAGTDIPLYEDFGLSNLMISSALSRGLYRAYALPMWGTHLAHEWYSWIPQANPLKFPSLDAALRLKYLAGAKLIINESGNWGVAVVAVSGLADAYDAARDSRPAGNTLR